jgi:hypothetical protein
MRSKKVIERNSCDICGLVYDRVANHNEPKTNIENSSNIKLKHRRFINEFHYQFSHPSSMVIGDKIEHTPDIVDTELEDICMECSEYILTRIIRELSDWKNWQRIPTKYLKIEQNAKEQSRN